MFTLIRVVALLVLFTGAAFAQSNPGLRFNQVPTAAQWNSYFAVKQDVLGFFPVNKAGDTMSGRLVTAPSATGFAGFNIRPGAIPTSPVNGDLWTTTAGFFVYINGTTVGPLASSFGSTINGATINSSSIGATTPATGNFSSLAINGVPVGTSTSSYWSVAGGGPAIGYSAGKVGIGTGATVPNQLLQIHQATAASASVLQLTTIDSGIGSGRGGYLVLSGGATPSVYLQNNEAGSTFLVANGNIGVSVGSTGLVGVGPDATVPTSQLHVAKNQASSTVAMVSNSNAAGASAVTLQGPTLQTFMFHNQDVNGGLQTTTPGLFLDAKNAAGVITLRTGAAPTSRMTIDATGRVAFGAAAPLYPLDIYTNSNIHLGSSDVGMFMASNGSAQAVISGGAIYNGTGASYTAKATSASSIVLDGGNIAFRGDTGLTPGGTFTASTWFSMTPAGKFLLNATGIDANGIAVNAYGIPNTAADTALQAALNTHKVVQLPCGVFTISSTIQYGLDGQTLKGSGRGCTIIKNTNPALAAASFLIQNGTGGTVGGKNDATLSDLTIDLDANVVHAAFTAFMSGTVMTVTGSPTGTIGVGQQITGTGVTLGTSITSLGTGTGGAGTYNISLPLTLSSRAMTSDTMVGCFSAYGAARLDVSNVGCLNAPNGGFQFAQDSASTGSHFSKLSNCYLQSVSNVVGTNSHAVEVSFSDYVATTGCNANTVDNFANYAFSSFGAVTGNTVKGSSIANASNSFAGARCTDNSNNMEITGNVFDRMPRGVMLLGCNNTVVASNSISNTQYEGIFVGSVSPSPSGSPTQFNRVNSNTLLQTCLNACAGGGAIVLSVFGVAAINTAYNDVGSNTYHEITSNTTSVVYLNGVTPGDNKCANLTSNIALGSC